MYSQQHSPSQVQSFAFRGSFLEQFPQLKRSLISNQFCSACRAGVQTVENVLAWVAQDARRRIVSRFADYEVMVLQRHLLATLDTEEAATFAEFILERERLSPREKKNLRAVDGKVYIERHMSNQPPTVKQLTLLKKLGAEDAPANRLEASRVIEQLLHRGEDR